MRDEHLHAFLNAARARTAVDTRQRRRWLTQQLDEDLTLAALCHALVDAHARVELSVASGRTYRGALTIARREYVAIADDDRAAYIAAPAIVGIRPLPGTTDGAAPRPLRAATFDDVVLRLSECSGAIDVCTIDGTAHRGRVAGVGRDLLWFDDGRYVRLDAVTEVVTSP
jgi:hypothetical protein